MSIKEREKELFAELEKKSSKPITKDGIVNEAEWLSMPIKCVFILKESIGESEKDLCNILAEGGDLCTNNKKHFTWWNIARWAYTIVHIGEDLDYNTQVKKEGACKEKRATWLSKIVALNVKKHGGKSRTNTKKLVKSFKTYYSDFLPNQLKLYAAADVIICCGKGVFDCLKKVFYESFGEKFDCKKYLDFDKKHHRKFYILGNVDDYKGVFKKGTLIIDYWHPAASKNNKMMNNLLRDIIRKELKR